MHENIDEEEEAMLRLDRRRNSNIKDWAVILTLIINLAGLVWTAAKWSSAIEQLQITAAETNRTMAIYGQSIQSLITDQALVKYKLQVNEEKLSRIK